jgi:hypothetical protein
MVFGINKYTTHPKDHEKASYLYEAFHLINFTIGYKLYAVCIVSILFVSNGNRLAIG